MTDEDVLKGLQVQLFIYLFALQNADPAAKPAAIFYQPLTARPNAGKTIPSGFFLNDERVLRAMERDLGKNFIPVSVNAKGEFSKKSPVKSEEDFAQLREKISELLCQLGESLLQGKIPAQSEDCRWCDYSGVCLVELR
ncbi:MAG: PD-(D/E)XK nuclease family protein, partial [Oscillospiraceae bacterium]|nr:PD-(D/E)XK nuclease family protein [Oscillospiraceae bacterium]